jgi:hypothetical protein
VDERERSARLELVELHLGEIERANPKPSEDEELAVVRKVLASAERVRRLCDESYTALYEGDDAVLPGLARVWKRLGELGTLDPRFEPYLASKGRDQVAARGGGLLRAGAMPTMSTRRPSVSNRWRTGWRSSNASSGSTGRPSKR